MKIACISDTHQHHKKITIPPVDMIIHAGDFTYHGELHEVERFLDWYSIQDSKYKILVCGNHEKEISKYPDLLRQWCEDRNIQLLRNEHTVVEGLNIFGSPYSVEFGNWAYGLPEEKLQHIWNMILPDTDILITHGPAYGRLDECPGGRVGSVTLRDHIDKGNLPNLKLHVTGHIHESRGTMFKDGYLTVNAAICGIPYTDVIINPITVEI